MEITRNNINQLIPCIRVKDVRTTMDYYVCELGFKPRYFLGGKPESGGVEFNSISIDFISGDMDRGDVSLNFLVDDVDNLYSACRKRALDIILKPQTTNGMRLFGIRDPNQYRLFFYKWVNKKEYHETIKKNQKTEIPERFKGSIIKAAVDAVRDGDPEVLKKLISIDTSIVLERVQDESTSKRSCNLLHVLTNPEITCLSESSSDIANILIKSGCETDSPDGTETGLTPLQLLLSKPVKNPLIVNLVNVLMEAGARIDDPYKSEKGMSAFQYAVLNGHTDAAKLMFPNVNRPGFVWLAGSGNAELVECFFADRSSDEFKSRCRYYHIEETSTNYIPEKNQSTLTLAYMLACINGQNEIVSILLNKGVDTNAMLDRKNFMEITATGLHWAAFHGHYNTVELLLRAGANIRSLDNSYSLSPAAWAAKGGNHEISFYLKSIERKMTASG